MAHLRYRLGVRTDYTAEQTLIAIWQDSDLLFFFGRLFTCIYCLSVWVGIAATVVYWIAPDVAWWLSLPFALSALVVFLERLLPQ